MRRTYTMPTLLCFVAGLVSQLFVSTPFGRVSMFDFAAYFIGPIVMLKELKEYGKTAKRVLLLAFIWLASSVYTDWYRGTDTMFAIKMNMIIFDSICMIGTGFWLLKKTPYAVIPFTMGNVISGVISLYYFQNGAMLWFAEMAGYAGQGGGLQDYLLDKQVYPVYMNMICCSVVWLLSYLKVLPLSVVALVFGGVGVFLMARGGARSNCLIYMVAMIVTLGYANARRFVVLVFKHKFLTVIISILTAMMFSSLYMTLAKNAVLGEEGFAKYEAKQRGDVTALDNRADILVNWPFLWRHPIVGAGSLMIDRWGYLANNKYATVRAGREPSYLGHSCIVGQWTACGIGGLLFWGYFLVLIFKTLGVRLTPFGKSMPFVLVQLVNLFWNILFSPYGQYRGIAMFYIAMMALLSEPWYVSWVGVYLSDRNPVKSRL